MTESAGSNSDERTPISPFSEPIPEIQHSVCNGAAEGDNCTCEPLAECSICLERCGGTGDGLTQLHCKHVFHSVCLERWLRSRGDCPYCRATPNSRMQKLNENDHESNDADYRTTPVPPPSKL